jgi:hypothetical protein
MSDVVAAVGIGQERFRAVTSKEFPSFSVLALITLALGKSGCGMASRVS